MSFGWSPSTGRYFNKRTGKFIPFSLIKDVAIEALVVRAEGEMLLYTDLFMKGEITLYEWQLYNMRILKNLHSSSIVAARGGLLQMSASDWGYAGFIIKRQYEFLRNFAQDIKTGKQKINGTLTRRVKMYAQAVRASFEQMRRRTAQIYGGATQERRVLGAAEHCTTHEDLEGCVELAAKKWQPINTLPRITETPCRTNCKCKFIFRKPNSNGKWDVVG